LLLKYTITFDAISCLEPGTLLVANAAVLERLRKNHNVHILWSQRVSEITDYLEQSHNRCGVYIHLIEETLIDKPLLDDM